MGKDRDIPSHAAIDHHLPKGIIQVIIPADDMGDPHIMVVNNHGQHVGGAGISPQDYHVVKLGVLYRDNALYRILNSGFPCIRHAHAHHKGPVFKGPVFHIVRGLCLVTPGRSYRLAFGMRRIAQRRQFFGIKVAAVGGTALQQGVCHLNMPVRTRRLADSGFIALQPKPCQPFMNGSNSIIG